MKILTKKKKLVPEPSLSRMPSYLAFLKVQRKTGIKHISSTNIARALGFDSTQVAKDISYTGIVGKTRVGYELEALIEHLEAFLGFTTIDEAFLFGAGSLGSALLNDHGLKQLGLKISAAFDVDKNIIGKNIGGVEVYDIADFAKVQETHHDSIDIAILTVPPEFAQNVANIAVENGIKALWNFTPMPISFDATKVVVQNTSLYAHLAVMFNRMGAL